MKLLKIGFLTALLTSFLITGCKKDNDNNVCIQGIGPIVTETLTVPSFTGINSLGSNNVIITQGAEQNVVAVGHENIIDLIETKVSGGIWDIELEDGCYNDYELTINITVPNIEEIQINGAGNIVVHDFVDQGDLNLEINGAGNIELNAFDGAENLSISIAGSGNIAGNDDFPALKNLNISITGSGNFSGFPINTNVCSINIAGSGDCEVFVNDVLNVVITGTGNVYYKGFPMINATITGTGNIYNSN
jgi:hypothetical protein